MHRHRHSHRRRHRRIKLLGLAVALMSVMALPGAAWADGDNRANGDSGDNGSEFHAPSEAESPESGSEAETEASSPAPLSAGAPAAPVTTGAIFNDPAGTPAQRDRIRNHVVSLVGGAAAGSSITVSLYTFTDDNVREALIAAKERGVAVRAILDYKSHTTVTAGGEYENLAAGLGTDRNAPSWVMSCPSTRSCVGNRTIGSRAINHNKFFLFSRTGGVDKVVVQTSANMTGVQRTDLFNNAVTIADPGLYDNYAAYFDDQLRYGASGAGLATYYRTPSSATDPAYKTYFFPRRETSGTDYRKDPATDTVKLILDKVACSSTRRSEVRMAANLFYRDQIASKLVAMKNAGCLVYLAGDGNPNGGGVGVPSLGRTVTSIVSGKLTQRVECWEDPPTSGAPKIGLHSKYLLVEGTYDGVADRKIVWTGSHNYSWQALRSNDETLLKIDNGAIHDQYRANHDHLMRYCAGT
ncbi:phospholipase D-like domain-containing protein [Streptomyces sp. 35G-GA-8]|uniref:phospholipase D-like domain-containing protein n=1 Tax=Streptomyces sp. 35G-GA-8 TaxID=2939434 RepID=UPI00201EC414|nr:phospholipase D-like domain-containing protein [Streptomyces sp. 35G-GA-8]MCL7380667.1 phospholipase D-like domain-containing protein [Streptomyces sp. 35G-GA-8]